MDLRNDFYLVRFQIEQNYNKVLHGGPWFIGSNFLTMRKWEPKFNSSTTECKFSVIWAKLLGLPSEYYD